VDENVLGTVLGCDETEALAVGVPLYDAGERSGVDEGGAELVIGCKWVSALTLTVVSGTTNTV